MGYTVGDVARLAHVTVRALHHYDEMGLLRPSGRTRSSYRLYTDSDLERLQQVLFFRELGFALEDIARIVGDPGFDRKKALVAQRALLVDKRHRLDSLVESIDRTLDGLEGGRVMKPEEMLEVFGDFDPQAHDQEAQRRWAQGGSYAESARRTKRYTKEDWQTIKAEAQAIHDAFAAAKDSGQPPTDTGPRELAERARLHIDRWFYPCSHEMHAALGQMYVQDPRFAANYERLREGLAQYVCDAIQANATPRREAKSATT
jgi:DNA-binding transcriptional MerR regulator